MRFSEVKGNDELKKRIAKMVDDGRVSHAMMLVENGGYGALPLALATIQYMSCHNRADGDSCGKCPSCIQISKLAHPDLHFAFPVNVTAKSGSDKKPVSENFLPVWRQLVEADPYFTEDKLNLELGIEDKVGTISVAEAKEILTQMNLKPYEGDNKYMLVWLPERMTTEASNRLLKIIEEPFPGTYFFFITQSPERIIDTIRSRCLRIQLYPMDIPELAAILVNEFSLRPEDATAYASNSSGNYGRACTAIREEGNISPYLTFLQKILEGCLSRDLLAILTVNDSLVELGREKQKEFCLYSESFLRKVLMVKKGATAVSYLTASEARVASAIADRLPEAFFERAYSQLENARMSVESNVNAKMVFCNLGNLFFVSVTR